MAWALASSSAALPPEFEMQRVSQSQKHSWVAWVLQEATRPKQENQRRPERHRFPRILGGYLLIRAAPLRVGGALPPYRTSHSVAM